MNLQATDEDQDRISATHGDSGNCSAGLPLAVGTLDL
jgi:hypothetical protein